MLSNPKSLRWKQVLQPMKANAKILTVIERQTSCLNTLLTYSQKIPCKKPTAVLCLLMCTGFVH